MLPCPQLNFEAAQETAQQLALLQHDSEEDNNNAEFHEEAMMKKLMNKRTRLCTVQKMTKATESWMRKKLLASAVKVGLQPVHGRRKQETRKSQHGGEQNNHKVGN